LTDQMAVLGSEGTFCDAAFAAYCKERKLSLTEHFCPTFEETFHAVGKDCEYGILPIENTLDGYVQRTLDLLLECRQQHLQIIDEITVPVQFSLVARTHSFEEIKQLYVQFKSNGQCRKIIQQLPHARIITTETNVESYEKILHGQEGDAAIIPHHLFSDTLFPFGIENVTDRENNFTRFFLLHHTKNDGCLFKRPACGKTIKSALYFLPQVDDKPGLLHEFLSEFSKRQINLISIMSRPTKQRIGTYHFYMEIHAPAEQWDYVCEAYEILGKRYPIQVLGMYSV
jgi:prephenate dehydratase